MNVTLKGDVMSKTRDKIIEVAIEVLSTDEFASLEAIAEKAGVSRMTIHRHFRNRETLFEKIHESLIARTLLTFQEAAEAYEDSAQQIREIIKVNAGGSGFHLLMKEHGEHEQHDPETCKFSKLNKELHALIRKLRNEGYIQQNVPDAWVFHMYDGVLFTAWEAMRNGSVAPRDIPDLAWSTFKNGVLNIKGGKF
jgi:AcrR family transcriptional regulator